MQVVPRIDNPISPRGDGNCLFQQIPENTGGTIDNPISPRGDGNCGIIASQIRRCKRGEIDNPISPRGDGNRSVKLARKLILYRSITPFPREGTETSLSR